MSFADRYRVEPGKRVRLARWDPADCLDWDKDRARKAVRKNLRRMDDLQYRLYAEDKRAVLVVLQAMDAGGKDGTIRNVFGPLNPQGVKVTSFKVPSQEEAAHDFLWRIHKAAPARGSIGVFNRSHYEDVLVVRVHDLVPRRVWSKRYDQINAFEATLAEAGTVILKFYLHISREEQLERFRSRLDDPGKQWKISESDYSERRHWDAYQKAFEDALSKCSTPQAPWYIVPADRKWYRDLVVSSIVRETLEGMRIRMPEVKVDLDAIREAWRLAEARAQAGSGES